MSFWDFDDRPAKLAKLAREGLSASQIARKLSADCTRNMVIAKAWRMGVSLGGGNASTPSGARAVTAPRPHNPQGTNQYGRPKKAMPVARAPELKPDHRPLRLVNVESTPRRLSQLGSRMCKWPIDMSVHSLATAESLFCAGRTAEDDVYCPAHRKLASEPPKKKQQAGELIRMARQFA